MKNITALLLSICMISGSHLANAADKVVMDTNWLAQGGHGGFYQAVADGTYAKHGLDIKKRLN